MSITKKLFGTLPDKGDVYAFTLSNASGMSAEILTYGGIIRQLIVPDKNGQPVDVVLGRDSLEEYLDNTGYFGAAIGRHSNRIANAAFTLNGKTYTLVKNDGNNNLHGGPEGFHQKVFAYETSENNGDASLTLFTISPDMEDGYPGELQVAITYTVAAENGLKLHYRAVSDQDTLINFTNHSYFNVSGHDSSDISDLKLWLNADFYTPNSSDCMPTGEVRSVAGTPFDFRTPKPVGQDIHADCEQLKMFTGYDHNFALNGWGYRKAASLTSSKTGITMDMYTDLPAVQLYTMNSPAGRPCKGGISYPIHQALCLETQFFPNAMSFRHFPGPIYKAGEIYDTVTEYRFHAE